jgi:hypothetical protein
MAWSIGGGGCVVLALGSIVGIARAGGDSQRELPWFTSAIGWIVAAFVCLVKP